MRSWNYVHADQVLPPRLVKEIRQYATGLLYIPTDIAQTRERTALRVRAMKEQGYRNCEIARILGITPRHVCGVLRRFQEATAITTPAGTITGDAPQGGHIRFTPHGAGRDLRVASGRWEAVYRLVSETTTAAQVDVFVNGRRWYRLTLARPFGHWWYLTGIATVSAD